MKSMRQTSRATSPPLPRPCSWRCSLWAGMMLVVLWSTVWPLEAVSGAKDELRLPLAAGEIVRIEAGGGALEVMGWERQEVRLRVPRHRGDADHGMGGVSLERENGGVRIRLSAGFEALGLTVWVPVTSDLDVSARDARCVVAGVQGNVRVQTSGGAIVVEGSATSVDARTLTGEIIVRAPESEISVETLSGSVELVGPKRVLSAVTVSGALKLWSEELELARLETVSGGIKINAGLALGGELEAESHSGAVAVSLSAETSARVKLSSFSGPIASDMPTDDSATGDRTFVLGDGAGRVILSTFSGPIGLASHQD